MPSNPVDEWSLVRDQFEALVRERSDNIENLLDAEFRHRCETEDDKMKLTSFDLFMDLHF
jgi:hypothetical protein